METLESNWQQTDFIGEQLVKKPIDLLSQNLETEN